MAARSDQHQSVNKSYENSRPENDIELLDVEATEAIAHHEVLQGLATGGLDPELQRMLALEAAMSELIENISGREMFETYPEMKRAVVKANCYQRQLGSAAKEFKQAAETAASLSMHVKDSSWTQIFRKFWWSVEGVSSYHPQPTKIRDRAFRYWAANAQSWAKHLSGWDHFIENAALKDLREVLAGLEDVDKPDSPYNFEPARIKRLRIKLRGQRR